VVPLCECIEGCNLHCLRHWVVVPGEAFGKEGAIGKEAFRIEHFVARWLVPKSEVDWDDGFFPSAIFFEEAEGKPKRFAGENAGWFAKLCRREGEKPDVGADVNNERFMQILEIGKIAVFEVDKHSLIGGNAQGGFVVEEASVDPHFGISESHRSSQVVMVQQKRVFSHNKFQAVAEGFRKWAEEKLTVEVEGMKDGCEAALVHYFCSLIGF